MRICPHPDCPYHLPGDPAGRFYPHGSYLRHGHPVQRFRCRACGRTFSDRSSSIDHWTHREIDYQQLMHLFCSGFSLRALSRHFGTSVKTIQNRIGRLSRTILPVFAVLQRDLPLCEELVADGIENFCLSQDFPNNIHLLVGKHSQFVYGFNYALMRRKGRRTEQQQQRCDRLYPLVDFSRHTIKKTFKELLVQMMRLSDRTEPLVLYTDERGQYVWALREDPHTYPKRLTGRFSHIRINSTRPRTLSNDLFSVNYMDREIRKDVAEFRRETVCFGRNVCNMLERMSVYLFHHNFIKRYRIGVKGEERTHAEVAGVPQPVVERIRRMVVTERRRFSEGAIPFGGFFEELWYRRIPTPLQGRPEYLPAYTN